jgi:hypothetical protein
MESILATGSDGQQLIPQLDPKVLNNQASYIISRSQTTTTSPIPVAGPGPGGIRCIKWNIVDANFLDLSSLHFSFTVNVPAAPAHPLTPLSAIPHCWFRRLVIKCNGATVEDLTELSRMESQLSMFLSTQKKKNLGDVGTGWAAGTDAGTDWVARNIDHNTSRRCTWRPLSSGFLQCGRYLPMMGGAAGSLSIELECEDATDAVLNGTNLSTAWTLSDLKIHVDSVTLTSEITNDYADLLLSGRSILIPYQQNSSSVQYLSGTTGDIQITLAKQFSRLASVFVSLAQEDATDSAGAAQTLAAITTAGSKAKLQNNCYLADDQAESVESYIQINSRRFPQFNTQGTKQHMQRLLRGLGTFDSMSHSSCISEAGYGNNTVPARQFVTLHDMETMPGCDSTGMLVSGGGTVQVTLKNTGTGAKAPSRAYIICHHDSVLELKDQSSIVYS